METVACSRKHPFLVAIAVCAKTTTPNAASWMRSIDGLSYTALNSEILTASVATIRCALFAAFYGLD